MCRTPASSSLNYVGAARVSIAKGDYQGAKNLLLAAREAAGREINTKIDGHSVKWQIEQLEDQLGDASKNNDFGW